MFPQASPDGTRICFLVDAQIDADTIRSVYHMNADGTGRKLVAEKARQPCWSPDGTKIAFVKQEFDRFNIADFASKGLYFYDLETGETTAHPNNNHPDEKKRIHHLYNPAWSGDGKWIVSTVHAGMGYSHGIIAVEVDGDRVVKLRIDGCRPNLSPDSTKITWSMDDRTVCVADINFSSTEPEVTNRRNLDRRPKLHLYHPDFSPEGKYVVYSVGPGGRMPANGPGTHTDLAEMVGVRGNWNLYLKQVDGDSPGVLLTTGKAGTNKEPEWLPVVRQKETAE
jgi:Tol biopolymer transport system component